MEFGTNTYYLLTGISLIKLARGHPASPGRSLFVFVKRLES
jgi:hypothetical protein